MYLTIEELIELTDRVSSRGQISWLNRNGWSFVVSALGRPKVLRAFAEKKGGLCDSSIVGRSEPDWSQWDGVRNGGATQSRVGAGNG